MYSILGGIIGLIIVTLWQYFKSLRDNLVHERWDELYKRLCSSMVFILAVKILAIILLGIIFLYVLLLILVGFLGKF